MIGVRGVGVSVGRTAKSAQGDRSGERDARIAKARQRRLELDKDKEARDARIDQAVVDVYLAQDERDDAAKLIEAAEAKMGAAIARILAEAVPMAQVAELTQLSVNQVQKLKVARREPRESAAVSVKAGQPVNAGAGNHAQLEAQSAAERPGSWHRSCPEHTGDAGQSSAKAGACSDSDTARGNVGASPLPSHLAGA
jgi:hypothetical protein